MQQSELLPTMAAATSSKILQPLCIFFVFFLLGTFVGSSFAIRPGNTIQGIRNARPFHQSQPPPLGQFQGSTVPPSGASKGNTISIQGVDKNEVLRFSTPSQAYYSSVKGVYTPPSGPSKRHN